MLILGLLSGATGALALLGSAAFAQSSPCIIHTVCPEGKALHTQTNTAAEGVELIPPRKTEMPHVHDSLSLN